MNKIDIQWYKALRFLSRLSVEEALKLKNNNPNEFRNYVSESLERTMIKARYIVLEGKFDSVVSLKGLEYLRVLEEIRRKDLTLIASVVAVIISFVALAKSMSWI